MTWSRHAARSPPGECTVLWRWPMGVLRSWVAAARPGGRRAARRAGRAASARPACRALCPAGRARFRRPPSFLVGRARLFLLARLAGLVLRRCAACGRVKGRETQLDLALRARSQQVLGKSQGLPGGLRPRLLGPSASGRRRVERVVLLAAIVWHCSAAARSFVLAALRALHLAPASAAPGSAVKEVRGIPGRIGAEDVLVAGSALVDLVLERSSRPSRGRPRALRSSAAAAGERSL